MRALTTIAATAVCCLCTDLVTGQQPPPQGPPAFRASTRLVHVAVVITGRDGRAVEGLTPEDFEIKEAGKVHPVAHFAVERDPALGRAISGATGPDVATNLLDGKAGSGATILLFDRLNTDDVHQQQALKDIIAFLEQLKPDDRIGFYMLESDGIRILHDFTHDAASLLRVLGRVTARTSTQKAGSEAKFDRMARFSEDPAELELEARFEEALRRAEQVTQLHHINQRAMSTTAALEALTLRLGGVTGRKNVIWVSSAFPLSFGQTSNYKSWTDEMHRATRALSHTDIAVYPVDAGGLAGAFTQAPAAAGTTLGSTGADYRAAADKTFSSLQSRSPSLDTMSVLAEQTGGRVYKNTNDLRAAMERAVDDTRLTYVIGYYPANEKWDGRFRPIDVKVNRRGVNVRHRSGYFAHPPLPLDERYRQAGLQEAMAQPLEATGIGLAVQSAPGDGNRVMLTLKIDPQGLALQREHERWNGSVEIAIAQRTSDKRLSNTFRATVPLTLTDDVRNELLKQGLTLSRTIDLPPDARQVIVGVRDVTSGAIGTVILDGARLKR